MDIANEQEIIDQLRKGQADTNERLDRLLAEQARTNQLLEWLGELTVAKPAPTPVRTRAPRPWPFG